jgi:hypothetical protein
MLVILIAFSCVALWFWGRGSIFGGVLMTPPLMYLGIIFASARETTEQVATMFYSQAWIGVGIALLGAWVPYMFHERQTKLTG